MTRSSALAAVTVALVTLAGCTSVSREPASEPSVVRPERPPALPPEPRHPAPADVAGRPSPPEVVSPPVGSPQLPPVFESADFVVAFAGAGDTADTLAARHLGDAGKAWMIRDFMGVAAFADGQEVVMPKRGWNPTGVFPWGYQVVPVIVYHNIGPESKGRLLIGVKRFEEQLRYLQSEGFQALTLEAFLDFTAGQRQLPRKSVLIAFDDGYRSFVQYARPLLKGLGFPATLFVYTDFLGGGSALSWQELRALADDGFTVQAHSKTHTDLRRRTGESDAEFARRMEAELGSPLALFRRHLGRSSETMAYPYGDGDEEVAARIAQYGYRAAFTVRRQSNPAFVFPFRIGRAQIYSEMGLPDFARTLPIVQDEPVGTPRVTTAVPSPVALAALTSTVTPLTVQRLASRHMERAASFEARGHLRQALEELKVALTIAPADAAAEDALRRVGADIERQTTALIEDGHRLLDRGVHAEARRRFLSALALDPGNRSAFEALQRKVREVAFIAHTVRAGETLRSAAELYYGDALRADVIAETNGLAPDARLSPGRKLRIPEIPGVPFLPR